MASRTMRSTVSSDVSPYIDFSDVQNYAAHLNAVGSGLVDHIWADWKQHWHKEIVEAVSAAAPRGVQRSQASRRYGPLHSAVRAVERGVTFGDAFYWRFIEYGTSRLAPRPFVKPTLKRLRPGIKTDAAQRAVMALRTRGG